MDARWRKTDGQAAVELVAVLPLVALLLLGVWQAVLAGHAYWAVGNAARAGARAAALGDEPGRVVRARLAGSLGDDVRVRRRGEDAVSVSAPIPAILGAGSLGRATVTAHFEEQS